MFIAHRGKVSVNSKENTIEAFKDAINDKKYQFKSAFDTITGAYVRTGVNVNEFFYQ